MKQAVDGNGIIRRMYESENAFTKAKLTVHKEFTQAQICNLLEEPERMAAADGNVIDVQLKPYEVVTVKIS